MKSIKYILLVFCTVLNVVAANAQQKKDSTAIVAYIRQYKDIAVQEMKRAGIPASITMAQGIHESSFGTSYLSSNTNNHFGIKCKENWTGKTFKYTDDAPNECFRVYEKVEDSYKDHSDFLKNRPYYQPLFKLDKFDYKAWAYGLKKCGYATNPKYAEILIKTIEDYQLYLLDKEQPLPYLSTSPSTETDDEAYDKEYNVTDSMEIDIQKSSVPEKKTEVEKPVSVFTPAAPPVTTQKITKNIFKVNNCKAVKIYTAKGETLDLLSNVLNVEKEDLLVYNDITDEAVIKDGQTIFLQQKKKSNKEGTYKVKPDDNLWSISQKKGVRLSALLKMNQLEAGEEPAAKETLVLKGKATDKPALRKASETPKITAETKKNSAPDAGIVRARDTIYPGLNDTTKLSVDSNKVLGWESDTKLLEKPAIPAYPVKKDTVVTTTVPVVKQTEAPTATEPATTSWKPEEKTVYPAYIDYNKLPKSNSGLHTVVKGDTMYNICKRYNISVAQLMQWNNLSDQSVKLGQVLKIRP